MLDLNIGKWVNAILSADQPVKALVGVRIYPVSIALAIDFPAISYRRLTTELPGMAKGLAGPQRPRVRINAWHQDYDVACAVSSAVLEAFKDGAITKQPTKTNFKVGMVLAVDAGDEYFMPGDASKDFLYGPYVDFQISYGTI